QHCPDCRVPVTQQTPGAIAAAVRAAMKKGAARVMAALVRGRKGFHTAVADAARRAGSEEWCVDGRMVRIADFKALERFKEHTVDAVVASLREAWSVLELDAVGARALDTGRCVVRLLDANGVLTVLYSRCCCPQCARSFDE